MSPRPGGGVFCSELWAKRRVTDASYGGGAFYNKQAWIIIFKNKIKRVCFKVTVAIHGWSAVFCRIKQKTIEKSASLRSTHDANGDANRISHVASTLHLYRTYIWTEVAATHADQGYGR